MTSEAKYSCLFENTLTGFAFCRVVFDENHKPVDIIYLEVNPAFEKILGLKKEIILRKKASKAIPELKGLYSNLFEIYSRVVLTGKKEKFEIFVQPLKIWLSIHVYSPEEKYFIAVFENITEHKTTNEETRRMLDSLHQENNKLHSLINSINEEVWFTDSEKQVTLVNPAVQKEFGLDSPMLLDLEKYTESLEVFRSEGSRRPVAESPSLRALKGEVVKAQEEIIRNPANGELKYRQVNSAPVRDPMGNTVGAVSIVHDITELRKIQNTLRESNRRFELLNEKLRVVGGLTRHDARNKLAIVEGNLHLTRKEIPGESEVLNYLTKIDSAIDQMTEIFNFASIYERIGIEKIEYMNVEKAIRSTGTFLLESKKVSINLDCNGLYVLADSLLIQLFNNLIDYSLKHSKKTNNIRVYYEKENDADLKIIYEDNGVGIEDSEKSKLFEEGYRTSGSTGYGLYLIKKIVEVYGWTIQETGEARKGVQFKITLPEKNLNNEENFRLLKVHSENTNLKERNSIVRNIKQL